MTRREEIEQLKAEIARLNKRLKVLESLSEPIEEKELSSFKDFHPYARILSRGGIITIGELISSNPEKLLEIRDIGEKKLETICQLMQKHGLRFI